MPGLRIATASGNWSNSATWDLGLIPIPGDTVASNGFTVNIDQDVNVSVLTNAAQSNVGVTATMTSNTTPSGYIAAASSDNNGGNPAWNAFRKDNASTIWLSNSTGTPQWLSYEFPTSVVINRYTLFTPGASSWVPINWTFEGWNGSSWDNLHTVTNSGLGTNTAYTSPVLPNITAYKRYRVNVTSVSGTNVGIGELTLYEKDYTNTAGATAGGGFILNSGYTATATATVGIIPGTTTCITYSGSGASTLNANVGISQNGGVSVLMNGSGSLNIVGNLLANYLTTGASLRLLTHNGPGTTNIIGDFVGSYQHDSTAMVLSGTGTINHTGNMYIGTVGSNNGSALSITNGIYNLTGNITAGNRNDSALNFIGVSSTGKLYVTGNVSKTTSTGFAIGSSAYINIVGTVSFVNAQAISSTGICLMSGPFICGQYGQFPYSVTRMHLIPTLNNYIEFRDNSTNGALSPGPIASASRMVSADTIIDAPLASNVRFGVSYGNGAYTGTCRIPSPSNVALNVPFDTGSIGTAFLTSDAIASVGNSIWNIPVANLTGSNTIGERMANSSTVDTMGNQLASLL